jgi:hypothetical protein
MYDHLWSYYANNGLYDAIANAAAVLQEWMEAMRPLYNPAHRSVEFFAGHIMAGNFPQDIPLVTDNARIVEPVELIAKWSQLNAKKPSALRWLSVYGDLFIHPASNAADDKTYLQFVKPHVATLWKEDERGNVVEIRLDIGLEDGTVHTEFWNKEIWQIWEHKFNRNTPLSMLGFPIGEGLTSDFNIDFCPFVHVKFKDVGEKRGWGAFTHVLDKIDESNRMASRLHQMLFRYNKAFWVATAGGMDSQGRPLPPPVGAETIDVEDDTIASMPGTADLKALIPDIKYGDALTILNNQLTEIERDLPELRYGEIPQTQAVSGRAIKLLLAGAIDRAIEARANWEQGLIRAFQMAISIRFPQVGSFDAGELDFTFAEREVIPTPVSDKAESMEKLTRAGLTPEEAAATVDLQIPEA